MSFDLYFAGVQNLIADHTLMDMGSCRLYSQLRDRARGKLWLQHSKENPGTKVFVDSGAFTAWTKGKTIDVDDYINYINTNTEQLTLFASVDNIPGESKRKPTLKEKEESPKLSWDNYLYMRERVKEPDKLLPVFHIGEDFKYLKNMLESKFNGKHIPYIGLGGTVGIRKKGVKENWYKECFDIIKESSNPNIKVHAFGMTKLDILESFPFTSADSTSWLMTSVYGFIYTKYGKICVSNVATNRKNHINKLPKEIQTQIINDIGEYGITMEQCINDYKCRTVVNIKYLQNWADNYKYKGN